MSIGHTEYVPILKIIIERSFDGRFLLFYEGCHGAEKDTVEGLAATSKGL